MTRPKKVVAPFKCGRFFTAEIQAWLGGYVPRIASESCEPAAGKPTTPEAAQRLADAQERGANAWRGKGAA